MKHDHSGFEIAVEYDLDVLGRRIYMTTEIEERSADVIIKSLHYLDNKPGDIFMWINSPGGCVHDSFAIYDAMRSCRNDVITIGTGQVCSAATLLLVGGAQRYATENCIFMAHEGEIHFDKEMGISRTTLESQLKADAILSKRYVELMSKHTGKTVDWWVKRVRDSKKELWFNTEQMTTNGIIDGTWIGANNDRRTD